MGEPVFYIVELDLPDSDLDGFLSWYANVHAPHLYEAGFTLCTSYRAVAGEMSLVDIYQADGPELFESRGFARYREVFAADPYRPDYIGRNRNTRTPYHHVPWAEPTNPDIARPLACDWLTIWRFAADEAVLARVAAWLAAEGAAALAEHGAAHLRLLRKGAEAPTGGSIRPGGALVVQWAGEPAGDASHLLPDWLAAPVRAVAPFTGYRLYPWPDDPMIRFRFNP